MKDDYMIPILSVVTAIKDYLEVVHKLIEYDSININYTELGSILTFFLISVKNCAVDFFSLSWLKNLWSLPIIIPEISSAMISEVSVLDGYFHNAFNFLDTPISYGDQNGLISCLEKLTIGLINSFFLFLPTSIAHIITLRRFVMQGLEAGYISGLGTIAGNIFWLASIIFGWRFFVIPWLSLDIFRYILGFILLVKYMWDSYNERKSVLEDVSKRKIFLLNFLLALTEQTSIYPFISNISISPEASMLETFASYGGADSSYAQFIFVHFAYLLGIALGSLSLLHFSCWFWENPAFKLYMWVISSFKVSTSFYYKALNLTFLYLTMLSAISSIPYYGLDYTITNPLGYVNDDRIIQDKVVLETSFLGTKASDRNTRRNRGRHGRRERWKRRIRKYRTFDASLYDQGIYDLFTVEDLNYGFDRFWLRRKLRNHRVRFRFFPGPWMRSFKKQLAKPRLESYTGPRIEFFRILFEQVYHPSFHAFNDGNMGKKVDSKSTSPTALSSFGNSKSVLSSFVLLGNREQNYSVFSKKEPLAALSTLSTEGKNQSNNKRRVQINLIQDHLQNSTLRKFVRKFDSRVKTAQILALQNDGGLFASRFASKGIGSSNSFQGSKLSSQNPNTVLMQNSITEKPIFSKQWKRIFSKLSNEKSNSTFFDKEQSNVHTNFYLNALNSQYNLKTKGINVHELDALDEQQKIKSLKDIEENSQYGKRDFLVKKENARKNLSKKDLQILRYRSLLTTSTKNNSTTEEKNRDAIESLVLLHPLKFYLQQDAALKRKLRYYSPSVYRKFSVENNAPYFRVMMKRYFYNYKPSLRWERTMKAASLRKARRKTTRSKQPRKLQYVDNSTLYSFNDLPLDSSAQLVADKQQGVQSQNFETNPTMLVSREQALLQKPTYNYSVVSKRASRYRYQIYKDVLQHWYYSPFNRLLLKFDVDSFIRRQPNAHFLTENEENLLHLRRFLLSEHYNTLRWYTNMEHYRSMKTNLNGGTKSFSSRVYNQQFSGTFKKIRHLFAITPSQGNVVLKFDQPLYNEYPNTNNNPLLNPLVIHEELLADPDIYSSNSLTNQTSSKTVLSNKQGEDLLTQSQNIVRQYLIQARSTREDYIKQLLNENNYTKLTQFIYTGQKIRGNEPVTNQRLLNNQEKDYLLNSIEKTEIEKQLNRLKLTDQKFMEDLYLTYLKKWKRRVNDQDALKNYLTRRLEKREKRKQKKEKQLITKLKRLEDWLTSSLDQSALSRDNALNSVKASTGSSLKPFGFQKNTTDNYAKQSLDIKADNTDKELLTSGLQNSIMEGMYILNKIDTKVVSSKEKSLWKVLLLSKIKEKQTKLGKNENGSSSLKLAPSLQDLSLGFRDLKNTQKQKLLKDIQTSTQATTQFVRIIKQKQANGELSDSATRRKLSNNIENLSNRVVLLYSSFKNQLPTYLGVTKIINLLKPMKRKSLNDWRKKERVLAKQKRSRKEFKLLNKKTAILRSQRLNVSKDLSTYLNLDSSINKNEEQTKLELALEAAIPSRKKDNLLNDSNIFSQTINKTYSQNQPLSSLLQQVGLGFKRKRSPQRRSRVRRNRGVFKKRTLSDSLKKDFKTFYGQTASLEGTSASNNLDVKTNFYKKINENLYSVTDSIFNKDTTQKVFNQDQEKPLKQRRSKQRKQRYWKQKRSKYSQKRRKYRKRRRYTIGKIRVLSKQFKRIKNKIEIQNWWWKQFIPSIQASTEALWQIERDKLIQQKLSELSTTEILERDSLNNLNTLQIGNKDFKPLALPETMRLKELQDQKLLFENSIKSNPDFNSNLTQTRLNSSNSQDNSNFTVVNKLYESLFINKEFNTQLTEFTLPNTNLPFYAGWDESLRKFVVTNRMLSRQEAGFEIKTLPNSIPAFNLNAPLIPNSDQDKELINNESNVLQFTQAPLQGMNAATTLYWQIPFTTYDPDQFFALGMDGFSPIGWRKFLFRHSILKTWLNNLNKNQLDSSNDTYYSTSAGVSGSKNSDIPSKGNALIVKSRKELISNNSLATKTDYPVLASSLLSREKGLFSSSTGKDTDTNKKAFAQSRRLKKRYRRVKKHPRTPVWFPSGPLLNQVLPVHYIYVFYKRARLPRDRYLKRRLLNVKTVNKSLALYANAANNSTKGDSGNILTQYSSYDFTLRKRLKPKRKYHLKRDYYSSNVVIPRRLKFMSLSTPNSSEDTQLIKKWRPLSSLKINKPIVEIVKEQKLLRSKQRRKELASKQQPNLRVKQLRRRVQRQILRSVWRYRPRAGGFVWPGDYLKLELVKAPKLQSNSVTNKQKLDNTIIDSQNESILTQNKENTTNLTIRSKKQKRKKKRSLVEWQIQPKKYLYEKHNMRVLKKKLEKAQRSDKLGAYKLRALSYQKSACLEGI